MRPIVSRRAFWGAGFCLFLTATGHTEPEANPLDLGAIEQRIESMRKREYSLQKLLQRDGSELQQRQSRIIARGRAYYRLSRALPQGDFMDHAVRVERLRQGLLSDMKRVRELNQQQKGAGEQLSLIRERRVPLEAEKFAAGRAQAALLSQEERERAFEQAFSVSTSPQHTAVYSPSSSIPSAGSFGVMRGQLPFPLPGRAEVEEVRRPYAQGPGLVLRAAWGTPARSVFAGRVAYASEFAEYGRTVIMDHGEGFFTVSSALSAIDVAVGEELPAGSRIGVIGGTGSRGEMYFEVRRGNETLAPREWFGI